MTSAQGHRERGLIQSGSEVRGWLEGRRTQFRVVVKPQPRWRFPGNEVRGAVHHVSDIDGAHILTVGFGASCEQWRGFAPYRPGDRVYVRETWAMPTGYDDLSPLRAMQECGAGQPNTWYKAGGSLDSGASFVGRPGFWRSPATMPKWASRLWLTVTEVRAERLQAITLEGADREGCGCRAEFSDFWDSRHRSHPWASNPWVWRVSCEVSK